jgi:LacI family transcriptional regulator, gluconate utilization system Gnt-I transcriptional repressor
MDGPEPPDGAAIDRPHGRRVTMADIAARAGVTKMTVSRALRNPDAVHPETRERIAKVVAQLGYVPDRVAASMSSRVTQMIGAVVPTLRFSIFADTLQGLSDVVAAEGYDLLLANSAYRIEAEEHLVRTLLGRRPDALVLTGFTHTAATKALLRAARIPLVETWEAADAPLDMAVGYSNFEAARAMTKALLAAGRSRVAFVNSPSGMNERARRREEGYARAMEEAGSPVLAFTLPFDLDDIRIEAGGQALAHVLERAPEADAVFFTSDIYAVGALLECRRRGWEVPGRIAVAGFHDLDIARLSQPTLTSVRVPAYEIGRQAGRLLTARLSGEPVPERSVTLPFEIVARESTGPLSAASP